jgi:hypothetical protein
MKGKIQGNGNLEIARGYLGKDMLCPYSGCNQIFCSDDCPQFGEPEAQINKISYSAGPPTFEEAGVTKLQICQGRILYFDEFIDERATP